MSTLHDDAHHDAAPQLTGARPRPLAPRAASPVRLRFAIGAPDDAAGIAAVRVDAARDLAARFGRGHWAGEGSERGVLLRMRQGQVWVARRGRVIVATFSLGERKPWAIDRAYFTSRVRPLYLTDMAVAPALQRRGVGRRCLDEAIRIARAWPSDAIRLDAYDAEAGAGEFYARCGYREMGRVPYRGVPLIYYELLL